MRETFYLRGMSFCYSLPNNACSCCTVSLGVILEAVNLEVQAAGTKSFNVIWEMLKKIIVGKEVADNVTEMRFCYHVLHCTTNEQR